MNHTVLFGSLLLIVFAASGKGVLSTRRFQTEMPDVASFYIVGLPVTGYQP